jgi:phage-related protein
MKGYGDAGVVEFVARQDGDAFRAVCTVRFTRVVYVLHAFQKKAKRGIATPKQDIDLIRARLKTATADYKRWSNITTGGRA